MNAMVPATQTIDEMWRLAQAVAKSNMFGMKTPEQALTLMAIAQAEGRHPALAARDYDIIAGKPAKKAEAMMRDFLEAGGSVEWHTLTDDAADATFSHPKGGKVRVNWDIKRASTAGLFDKNNMWQKYPRQMLRSRVVSEGVRTVWPLATSGFYVPEEVGDFKGPTIDHEVKEPQDRESINRDVPLDLRGTAPAVLDSVPLDKNADQPRKRTLADAIDELEAEFAAAETRDEVDAVLASEKCQRTQDYARGDAQTRLQGIIKAALDRTPAPTPPDSEVDAFCANARKLSVKQLNDLDSNAAHRRWIKSLSEADYARVAAALADRMAEAVGGAG